MKAPEKLNNIQLLRAFAAISVVYLHTGFSLPFLRPFGGFGVDVFFVISGCIMARILDSKSGARSDFFLRRRILRIVPPYWLFTLLLFSIAFLAPRLMGATRANGYELLKSLLFIPFAKSNGVVEPVLFVGWSLNYEMYFYIALAIGLLISKRFATWIGSAIVLATMLACMPFAESGILAHFYASGLMMEFLFGILSYYICRAIPGRTAQRFRIPILFVCFAGALLLIAMEGVFHFGYLGRVLNFGVPAFFLVTAASLLSQAGWDTNWSVLVLLGDASYILYLTHTFCEYAIDRILGVRSHWLRINTFSGAVLAISLSVLVSVLIHVYGERPTVRFLNSRLGGKRVTAEFGVPA